MLLFAVEEFQIEWLRKRERLLYLGWTKKLNAWSQIPIDDDDDVDKE